MDPYTYSLAERGFSFEHGRTQQRINDPFPMNDQRSMKQLAEEVLKIQDASNLPGVLYTWNESIRRLMRITTLSSEELHKHPINILFCMKVDQLCGIASTTPVYTEKMLDAVVEIEKLAAS